jgi:pyrrolidone-carboxylate peptidase
MRVIFMHIPILPAQVESRWSDVPAMSLTTLREAVAVTIQAVLECALPTP